MRPSHPAFRIALSTASILVQPCSGMTSGRYVAVKGRFEEKREEKREGDGENVDGVEAPELGEEEERTPDTEG